jgi:hypothetical protein
MKNGEIEGAANIGGMRNVRKQKPEGKWQTGHQSVDGKIQSKYILRK